MKISFKKRIAFYNTLAVALTTAAVFICIYFVVYASSYQHLDSDILLEKAEILNTLDTKGDSIIIYKMPEWVEAEHKKVEVNPTFIQIVNNRDYLVFKSPNLQANQFAFYPGNKGSYFYNTELEKQKLRLGQFPIKNEEGKTIGQLSVGISQQESSSILEKLLFTLCIAYPMVLLILYGVIYFAASRAIAPVYQLIHTASSINDKNLSTRLPLPEHEDEIYQLTSTINDLLNRLENSIHQQKQFTSDASHEIRTPLAAMRGTLEILIRKKREPQQYEEKITEVIAQSDRLTVLLDQLLQLARLESTSIKKESVSLNLIIAEAIQKFQSQIESKSLSLNNQYQKEINVNADPVFLSIIIDNLLNNAIKYSPAGEKISIEWEAKTQSLSFTNAGEEIKSEHLPYLFNRFFRADISRSSSIPGSGLGLAIVKKLADLQGINISISTAPQSNCFSLTFS